MKNHPIAAGLVAILMLSVLANVGFAYRYVHSIGTVQGLQVQTAMANRNLALAQAMAKDAAEYSKRNPAIDPILQSVGISVAPGPEKPSTRPASKK